MKIRYTHFIFIALLILSSVLAYDAFASYINRYLTVSQVVENSATYYNKEKIRVMGTVANGSRRWEDGSWLFNLTDGESTINVTYTGSLPSGFKEGEEVVVTGKLIFPDTLKASGERAILVKCPSKYEGGGNSLLADPIFLTAMLLGSGAIVYSVVSIVSKRKQPKI